MDGATGPLPPSVVSEMAVAGPPTGAAAEAETLSPAPVFDVLVAWAIPELAPFETTAVADAFPEPSAVACELALAAPATPFEEPVPPAPAVPVDLTVTFVPLSVDVNEIAAVALPPAPPELPVPPAPPAPPVARPAPLWLGAVPLLTVSV
jgi:hypothetical protein